VSDTGEPGGGAADDGRTTVRRAGTALRDPLTRVILAAAGFGGLAVAAVAGLPGPPGAGTALVPVGQAAGPGLWVGLAGFICLAELVAVRVRHRDGVEELTLLDPVVVLAVLFLPARAAVAATVAGLATAYLLRRRSPHKAAFNIGTYLVATAALAGLAHLVAGPAPIGVGWRLVAAVLAGTAGFVAVNLVAMSVLFHVLGAGTVRALLRQDLWLTGFTLATTVALSATAVTIAVHTPGYLPFTVLPAAAITYAYRAIATEEEERRRGGHVLVFTESLAAGPDRDRAVTAFVRVARDGFDVDDVLVGFPDGELLWTGTAEDPVAGFTAGEEHRGLLDRARAGPALAVEGLPAGWATGLVVPLEASGAALGAVAVGRRTRRPFRPADLTVLTSLASALAAALSSARNLAELVAETDKLRTVLDQSSDGILVVDRSGAVQLWNPAMARLTGLAEAEATGRDLTGLLSATTADGTPLDLGVAGRGQLSGECPRAVVDAELHAADGERRSVRLAHAAAFDADGQVLRDVVNVHDLTRERRVERLKSDFVATVSHELRTPITPLKGYAELLLRKGDGIPAEKRARALASIVDRADHLARLVEDLLLAAHIDGDAEPARRVQLDSIDLVRTAARAMEDFAGSASRLRLSAPADPVTARADGARTIQILTNLISNAVKYSEPGTPIDVGVAAAGQQVRVSVRDHGRGVPVEELEAIFEKFHRVEDPMVMSTGGTGLGLYIARHLARAMGGDLTARSRPGDGSTFTLTLPAPETLPAPDGSAPETLPPSDGSPPDGSPPDGLAPGNPRGETGAAGPGLADEPTSQ
jgi:PAS domain S-box-containing protein